MRHAALVLLPALLLAAQESSLSRDLNRAARTDLNGLRQLQARLSLDGATPMQKAYAEAHLNYQLVAQTRAKDPKGAEALLDRTLKALAERRDAESLALRGACMGLKIGFQPGAAMNLAPAAEALFREARSLAPASPRVQTLHAVHVLHTPEFFGGGAQRALPLLEAAVKAADVEQAPADAWAPVWGRAESLAWLGYAQLEADLPEAAKRSLDAALAVDPAYGFVRAVLLPKVEVALAKSRAMPAAKQAPKAAEVR
jgi:hypothetical protein